MAKKAEQEVSIAKLEERRDTLKKELEELQGELEQTMDELREGMTSRMDPNYWIRKYPFQSLGLSVLLGLWFGTRTTAKKSTNSRESRKEESVLWSELKRAAIRKGVQKLIDTIDERLEELNKS